MTMTRGPEDLGRPALRQGPQGRQPGLPRRPASPHEPLLSLKGIAVALADGIASSTVSQIASELAVKGFLDGLLLHVGSVDGEDLRQRVLDATNSWLHAQTRKEPISATTSDKGYVCTFSAMVIKATTAHIFHVGDCRVLPRAPARRSSS